MIKKIALGLTALVITGCAGVGLAGALADRDKPAPVAPAVPAASPAHLAGKPSKAGPVTIAGDDIVQVGVDAPVGTYRTKEKVGTDPLEVCYWMKSKDPEGSDIIDNDIPSGGRPQVTLKKGQWFTSKGCPEWVKQ